MNQKLTIGEPFLETRIIEDESAFPVKGPAILLNLDTLIEYMQDPSADRFRSQQCAADVRGIAAIRRIS